MDLSASSLFANVFVSAVGFGIVLYGKKQRRAPQLVTGLVLMVFPYFVTEAMWMLTIAGVLIVGLWFAVQRGA